MNFFLKNTENEQPFGRRLSTRHQTGPPEPNYLRIGFMNRSRSILIH